MNAARRLLKGGARDPGQELAQEAGRLFLCGVDEAGRGPLAGPVVAGAVVAHVEDRFPGVADSKALRPEQRQALLEPIRAAVRGHAVGLASVEEIDRLGILRASLTAMHRAVTAAWTMAGKPECIVLVDGRDTVPGLDFPQHALVRGDARCAAIAAGSILAKEHRDALLVELHQAYPHYGFDQHKGYATAAHLEALVQHGPSPHHRTSFDPVKTFLRCGTWQLPRQLDLLGSGT